MTQGLLTRQQGEFVVQHFLVNTSFRALLDRNVQEMLGVTEAQRGSFAEAGDAVREREGQLIRAAADGVDERKIAEERTASFEEYDAALKRALTPNQLEKWTRLTAERTLPAQPPRLPAMPAKDAAKVESPSCRRRFAR